MTRAENSRCNLIERWIHLSLDGELSPELEEKLESHLDACLACRQRHRAAFEHHQLLDTELQDLTGNMDELLSGRLGPEAFAPPEELEERLPRPPGRSPWSGWRGISGLAAAAVLVGLVMVWWHGDAPGEPAREVAVGHIAWTGGGVVVGDQRHPGSSQGTLTTGSAVLAPEETPLTMTLSDPRYALGTATAANGGHFTTEIDGDRLVFQVEWGAFHYDIDRAQGFLVRTPLGEVEVVGTRFTVQHTNSPKPVSCIEVESGEVRVRHRGGGRRAAGFAGLTLSAGRTLQLTEKTMTLPSPTVASGGTGAAPARHPGKVPRSGATTGRAEPAQPPAGKPAPRLDMPVKKD